MDSTDIATKLPTNPAQRGMKKEVAKADKNTAATVPSIFLKLNGFFILPKYLPITCEKESPTARTLIDARAIDLSKRTTANSIPKKKVKGPLPGNFFLSDSRSNLSRNHEI